MTTFRPLATAALLLVPGAIAPAPGEPDPAADPPPAVDPGPWSPERHPINEIQDPALVYRSIYNRATPENVTIRIVLKTQRAYFLVDGQVAIDTPVSTGTPSHPSPTGQFQIIQKKLSHRSNLYGDFVSRSGRVVRRGVSSRQRAPKGSYFRGTAMPYWQRLTEGGVGMHVGRLPGHPASHGCLRFPATVMPLIYSKTRIGTPVTIE